MKRKISKKLLDEFYQEVCCLIEEHGGRLQEDSSALTKEHRMPTKVGMITFKVVPRIDHFADIFGRFDISTLGKRFGGSATGKCNHHFWDGDTKDSCFARFEQFIKRITLKEVQPPCPVVLRGDYIEENVNLIFDARIRGSQFGKHFMQDKPYMSPDRWFSSEQAQKWFMTHCRERLTVMSWSNPAANVALFQEANEVEHPVLITLVDHWLAQYLECPDKYRDLHPLWNEPGRTRI